MLKNFSILLLFVFAILTFTFADVFAYPNGYSGGTLKTTTNGCSSCHSKNTTITGAITGPDTVVAGQTYTFTLTLTTTGGSGKYGVDIAAQNGTLAVISGQGLKVLGSELVQSSAITWVSPKVITFSYTAPSSAGKDTLYATVDRGHSGAWNWAPNKKIVVKLATGVVSNEIPVKFSLSQNFPNPFNPTTNISFDIPKSEFVNLSVYDLSGKKVDELVNSNLQAGKYSTNWNASKLSSGVYLYKITAGEFTDVKKLTLIK